jgi:hypothetical protein
VFYDYYRFQKSLNATFITLIPRKSGAIKLMQYKILKELENEHNRRIKNKGINTLPGISTKTLKNFQLKSYPS